jgi:micrococcal nuclease
VNVHVKSVDKYKRRVAIVILPGGDVYNEKVLEKGFAWHYKQYSNDDLYAQLENNARHLRLGIWGSSDTPIAPWLWRRGERAYSRDL